MTAPTPTIGRSGYSRLLMGSKRSSVEKCSGLDVGKLPSVTAVFRDEAELRLPTDRRRGAVVLFQFHFHVDHGDASAILHGSLTHVEVEVHGIVAVEECHDLVLECLASTHAGKIKGIEHLLLHVAFEALADLVQETGCGLGGERCRVVLTWCWNRLSQRERSETQKHKQDPVIQHSHPTIEFSFPTLPRTRCVTDQSVRHTGCPDLCGGLGPAAQPHERAEEFLATPLLCLPGTLPWEQCHSPEFPPPTSWWYRRSWFGGLPRGQTSVLSLRLFPERRRENC